MRQCLQNRLLLFVCCSLAIPVLKAQPSLNTPWRASGQIGQLNGPDRMPPGLYALRLVSDAVLTMMGKLLIAR